LRVVVTGGAGFIGSHIVDRLLADGYSVTVWDNFLAGTVENLKQHDGDKRLKVVNIDIRHVDSVGKLLKGQEVVFHLAAHANIRASLVDHRADLDHNIIGTLNILEGMLEHGVRDLVFASTSAVYGKASVIPTPEDYGPVQTSLYGASKLACEAYAEAYTQFAPIKFWGFRFVNVVGERCRRGVVWDFIHKLRRNPIELEILGDGRQSKEYLYVKDCVDGIMIGYEKTSDSINIFNLGLEEQTSVDRVADIVIEEMKLANVVRRYTGGPRGWVGDNPVVHLSVDKMKKIGWEPKVSPEEAIRRTARWTMQNTHIP